MFIILLLSANCLLFQIPIIGAEQQQQQQEQKEGNECRCTNETLATYHHRDDDGIECRCIGIHLLHIPENLNTNVEKLIIEDAGLRILKMNTLQPYARTIRDLTLINLEYFHHFEPGIFSNLTFLDTIYIHHAPNLVHIDNGVFNDYLPRLKTLRIVHTGLETLPNISGLETNSVFPTIDLENNRIRRIGRREVRIRAEQMILNYNYISVVEEEAFYGSQIAKLSLKGNIYLTELHPKAFSGLDSLRFIFKDPPVQFNADIYKSPCMYSDLSNTAITILPVDGLSEIEVLKVQDTTTLKVFPSVYNFKSIRVAWLTYPYHCCAFRFPSTHNPWEYAKHEEFLRQMHETCSRKNNSNSPPRTLRTLLQWHPFNATIQDDNNVYYQSNAEFNLLPPPYGSEDEIFGVTVNPAVRQVHAMCGKVSKNYREVKCQPGPDAFNPCEDLMGNWALRVPVWFISLSAIIGNLLVIVVIITSHFRLTVSKFLMVNLAVADLCIGLHLFLIAIVDACSIGFYFNYAIYWQRGDGCNVAGFLTVFGNVLSVYTLAVITTERWYTITWAIHLNKRLKLHTAVRVMVSGWICALFMATLPLFGVSSYSKTSICLPLEMKGKADVIYLSTLLAFNAIAFALICVCYGSMYKSIREGNQCTTVTSVRSDLTVAKRMALLVFTDFACWAPIAFFGLTAILGYPLITVTQTKILLVFFYPLNSCANPCLYALLTQQYRRDFFILMGRYGLCKDRAERHKGAIGGVPLPYGSGPQYKRPSSGATDALTVKHNNDHRSSVLTTIVSVEMPLYKINSGPNSRPSSLKALHDRSIKSTATNYDLLEPEYPIKYLNTNNL